MDDKYNESAVALSLLMTKEDELFQAYTAEMQKMQLNLKAQLESVSDENQRALLELEAESKKLEQREEELKKKEETIQKEKQKLDFLKKMNERVNLVQQNSDQMFHKLAEDHKRKEEKVHKRIIKLEEQLGSVKSLELDLESMRSSALLEAGQMELSEADIELERRMNEIQEKLKNGKELIEALIMKECKIKDELQDARTRNKVFANENDLEQKKDDERMQKLAEDQKGEIQELYQRIIKLEKQLTEKQPVEQNIKQVKYALWTAEFGNLYREQMAKKKMATIEKDLRQKEEELESLKELAQHLIIRDRNNHDELQDAREELMNGFMSQSLSSHIGVKRMGELDSTEFNIAAKRMYHKGGAEQKALELFSFWDDRIGDPAWYPFKVVRTEGHIEEIIDEEDESLKSLRNDLGDGVYFSVITALEEMNSYNPLGRYPVPELWNCECGRKATLREGVSELLKKWKKIRRR